MDWKNVIQQILDKGLSQARIAELCRSGQSHISSLYNGKRLRPNWDLGHALIGLCDRVASASDEELRALISGPLPTSTASEAAPLALGIQAMRPAQGASPALAERGE